MSPRRSSPNTAAGPSRSADPYPMTNPQRQAAQSKTKKREQFSACGACRMRRVRCDLKDLPVSASGQPIPCSNCRERGLKCVDEFAEVKAVKQLRRGRRLQQVEAVYGKTSSREPSLHYVAPPQSVIPKLKPEFFHSDFFRRFHIQRPILDPVDFEDRYVEFLDDRTDALSIPGQLIAMTLVIWAAAFGVDESGHDDLHADVFDVRQRGELVNEMLEEMLYLVDIHGILRKPSWDGVRLLLLLLPLTQEVQSPINGLVMHETTLSQVHTLCTLAPASTLGAPGGEIGSLAKARIFWYAYTLEGTTSGLRGGRLLFTDDDLATFEANLLPRGSLTDPFSPLNVPRKLASVPLRISSLCRGVHNALTDPRARRKEDVDEESLNFFWNSLQECWTELEELSHYSTNQIDPEDISRHVSSWQIFIFECHNVIREALKQLLMSYPTDAFNRSPGSQQRQQKISRLYDNAEHRCHNVVRSVLSIIQRNIRTTLFPFDAAHVRDGCFFAAFLLAGESTTRLEDIEECLQALGEMRFLFSKSDERMQTIQLVWESRGNPGSSRSLPSTPPTTGSPSNHPETSHGEPSMQRQRTRPPAAVLPLTYLPLRPPAASASTPPNAAALADGQWATMRQPGSRPGSVHSGHGSPPIPSIPSSSAYPQPSPSPSHHFSSRNVMTPASTSGSQSYYMPPFYGTYSDTGLPRQAFHPTTSLPTEDNQHALAVYQPPEFLTDAASSYAAAPPMTQPAHQMLDSVPSPAVQNKGTSQYNSEPFYQ